MKTFKTYTFTLSVIKSLIILLLATSCELFQDENPFIVKDKNSKITTYYGPAVTFGKGKAQAFISLSKDGKPFSMGIGLKEKAFEDLPTANHGPGEHLVHFPKQIEATAFQFMTVGWLPDGHEPAGIYNVPHFDIHFYMISDAKRMTITPLEGLDPEIPLAKYLPENYVQGPGRVPMMGNHWIDVTSPEFNGNPFTKTFIYGTFKQDVIFWEPMVTLEYFKSNPSGKVAIPQPEAYHIEGYYPTKYEVKYNNQRKEYQVILTHFVFRQEE
jgi:hypothetical protein